MRPLHDRVIVRPDEPEKKIGNILLPDDAQRNTLLGTVVAVGPGKTTADGVLIPMQVKAGDRVYYGWGGNEVEHNGDRCLALREDDLIAVVD